MEDFEGIVSEASGELFGGIIIGKILERIFPPFQPVTSSNFWRVGFEILGQVFGNAIFAAEFYKFQESRGFPKEQSKTGNIIFSGISLFVIQGNLSRKIASFANFAFSKIDNSFHGVNLLPSPSTSPSQPQLGKTQSDDLGSMGQLHTGIPPNPQSEPGINREFI